MTPRTIEFEPEVADDVAEAIDWYADQRPGLEAEFEGELQSVLSRMTDLPETFPPAGFGLRRGRLKRFPYSVFFRVLPTAVRVIAVVHDKRDPNIWQSRA